MNATGQSLIGMLGGLFSLQLDDMNSNNTQRTVNTQWNSLLSGLIQHSCYGNILAKFLPFF